MSTEDPFDPEKELPAEYRSGATRRGQLPRVSWWALALPILIALLSTMYIVDYRASSTVPDGVTAVQARVTGTDRRNVDSDYTSVSFTTTDGHRGRVTIDRGDPVPSTLTVWQDDRGDWQTTAAKSTFRYYASFLGYVVALVLAVLVLRLKWPRRDTPRRTSL